MTKSLPVLGADFTLRELTFALNNITPTQVLTNNPNRYAIVFCTVTGGQINLGRSAAVFPGGSLTMANAANASQQYIVLTWNDVAALVQDQWWAESKGAAETIGIQEILYTPVAGLQ